jgi:hypothetical protein
MYNDAISQMAVKMEGVSVGTSSSLSSVLNIYDCRQLSFAMRASTFAGTPDNTAFVKLEKVLAYSSLDGTGAAVELTTDEAFIQPISSFSVKNSYTTVQNGLRAEAMKYSSIKFVFISSDAGNTVQLTTVKTGLRKSPV